MKFRIKNTTRPVRFFFQRLFRGFDDSELWNLDSSFVDWVIPRLKRFKEIKMGYPGDLTQEYWDHILDEMITGFEAYRRKNNGEEISADDESAAYRAFSHFKTYCGFLWT